MHEILQTLSIGDRLVRDKGILTKHHGIFAGYHNGQYLVGENNTPHGVRYVTYSEFLDGNNLVRVERMNFTRYEQNRVIEEMNKRLGWSYSFLNYNCESFVNDVYTGVAKSSQVQTGVIATLFIAAIALLGSANNR